MFTFVHNTVRVLVGETFTGGAGILSADGRGGVFDARSVGTV